MVQEYQLCIDGKPARHVSAADWPWTWEFSEDNTRVHELQYAVNDAGLDVIITGIGFYPRLRTRRENATDIHTQRLCYREYNDTTYLYIGGYGLLQRK